MYEGATPHGAVKGMFSFAPCLPADADGFERPPIRLAGYVNPRNWRQVTSSEPMEIAAVADVWKQVVQQVTDAGLALATQLDLSTPRRLASQASWHTGQSSESGAEGLMRVRTT